MNSNMFTFVILVAGLTAMMYFANALVGEF